jgi:hypothetical protein
VDSRGTGGAHVTTAFKKIRMKMEAYVTLKDAE